MDKAERLLDLVAFFLDAKHAVPWRELRDAFPDEYAGSEETAMRKFERDKAELLELGIPLTWAPAQNGHPEGYALDRNQYYLPEAELSPEELAVLYAAGSAALESEAFPGKQDLAHALRKIVFFADGPLPVPQIRLKLDSVSDTAALPGQLETLWAAIGARKWVDLDYFSPRQQATTTRRVDPWGLALRRGLWHLVGWCHLRQGLRTFYVHRIRRLATNTQRPKVPDFEIPSDFQLDRHVATWPWQHPFHEPIEVRIELSEALAPLAGQLFGVQSEMPNKTSLTVTATNVDALLHATLSMGPEVKVVAPPELVERRKALAQKILTAHLGVAS